MQKYAAFVSGLPTGKNSISDDDLSHAFLRLGFTDPQAMLNSGNVVFDTPPVGVIGPLEAQISRHLRNTFEQNDIWTFIRTPDELHQILEGVPFSHKEVSDKGNSIYVVLLSEQLDQVASERIQIKRNEVDELEPAGREIYWLRRITKGEHIAPPPISEMLDSPATVRSLHAIQRILNEIEHPSTKRPRLVTLDDAIRSDRSRQ